MATITPISVEVPDDLLEEIQDIKRRAEELVPQVEAFARWFYAVQQKAYAITDHLTDAESDGRELLLVAMGYNAMADPVLSMASDLNETVWYGTSAWAKDMQERTGFLDDLARIKADVAARNPQKADSANG